MQGVTCFKYVSDVLLVAMENRHLLGFGVKTPKALASYSPGLERSDNPGITLIKKNP